jgi:hypothetical protein
MLVGLVFVARHFLTEMKSGVAQNEGLSQISADPHSENQNTVSTALSVEAPSHAEVVLDDKDRDQVRVFEEIIASKNDNDPRMDRLLRDLSEPVKNELRKKYTATPLENRNERGTVVFLIGREVSEGRASTADLQFLKEVLLEKPCLSLVDCTKSPASGSPDEQHLDSIHETTADYPQLMGLRYLRQALQSEVVSPVMREAIQSVFEAARQSPNPRVVTEAQVTLGNSNQK